MEIDSAVLYKPSEEQRSSALQQFEELQEEKPYEKNLTFSAEIEKAFSSAALSPPSEGESPQTFMEKFFSSLTASEGKEDQISEQQPLAQEPANEFHDMIPEDDENTETPEVLEDMILKNDEDTEIPDALENPKNNEDTEIPEVLEDALTETAEIPMQLQQPEDDAEETITIRMRRKRKVGMSDTSLLNELNQLTPEDPDRMFLLSMMPAMKRVRLDKVDEVRLTILEVIRKNRCPSTINSSQESMSLLSRNLSLEERSVSKADGEPVVPNTESLIDNLSLSVESESEPSTQSENME